MKKHSTFAYVATPYSKYPEGIEKAYELACGQTAFLLKSDIPVYSPIAATHGIAIHGNIDPLDHDIWLTADHPFMELASALIVCKAESWTESYGMKYEIEYFISQHKPIFYMELSEMPEGLKAFYHE